MQLSLLGRGPRIAIFVAVLLTFLIAIHLSSLPRLSRWKLPILTGHQETADDGKAALDLPQNAAQQPSPDLVHGSQRPGSLNSNTTTSGSDEVNPPCRSLEGGDDVLVVMRTGATEIGDKLPVHLDTTFQCYKNLVIFSDYAEKFHGHEVHDVLKDIPDGIKLTNEDFKHYLHVQQAGRQNLGLDELSGNVSYDSGPVGKNDNAGWKLDKWKFLPMANQTFNMHPDKKWFVFVEPDTYVVWSNLLQWLPRLDSATPHYYGSEVMIGDDIFAHGGSAFVLSKPALEKVAKIYNDKAQEWHDWTAQHWAGDCVLGRALHEAGVELTWSWPQFQGGNPSASMDWHDSKDDKHLWCTPAISYHHFSPSEVEDFWHFEQSWIRSILTSHQDVLGGPFHIWGEDYLQTVLHHRDTFKTYVMPNLTSERHDWDNKPEVPASTSNGMSLHDCKRLCEDNKSCMQYALNHDGCSTGMEVRMGQQAEGVWSGWMPDRVKEWTRNLDQCKGAKAGWTVT